MILGLGWILCCSDCCDGSVLAALLPQRVAWSADLNGLLAGIGTPIHNMHAICMIHKSTFLTGSTGMVDPETSEMCKAAAQWFSTAKAEGGAPCT